MRRSFYYLPKMKPWLWCLTITVVGISDISRHFLTTALDGVIPPIYKAETNSILFPPKLEIVFESWGEVDITSNNISWLFILN